MSPLRSGIDPTIKAFLDTLDNLGRPEVYQLSVEEARAEMSRAQAGDVAKLPADIEDRTIPAGPQGQISIRIIRPKGNDRILPAVLYFHGGGWVRGDKDAFDRVVREIANGADAAVVFVDYTRSPEARFPVAIEEAYAATEYIAANGGGLNLDPTRIAVAGDSAGGNMAAAVTLLAKERSGPHITFQVLFNPATNARFDTPSYEQFATSYFLTREAMKWYWNHYLPDEAARKQPTASPLQAPINQLKGLPPALIITSEFDVLRDEGEAYAHKFMEAGVPVAAVRYLGAIHAFTVLNAIAVAQVTRSAIALANYTLRKAFAGM
jgi:acetyl esterase